jgi:hypothetical protein
MPSMPPIRRWRRRRSITISTVIMVDRNRTIESMSNADFECRRYQYSISRCRRRLNCRAGGCFGCAYRKSSPSILVMQSAQDRTAQNAPRCLSCTVISARPCSTISECAGHYSSPCRIAAHGADGVRRTPRYDRGIPCGSSRSTVLRMRFARVNAERRERLEDIWAPILVGR